MTEQENSPLMFMMLACDTGQPKPLFQPLRRFDKIAAAKHKEQITETNVDVQWSRRP